MPCLLKNTIPNVKDAIAKSGGMSAFRKKTMAERIQILQPVVDLPGHTENAIWLNHELEKRLLKPGQTQAVKDWLKRLEKKGVPVRGRQPLLDRIQAKQDVLNPTKGYVFMESLAKQALGFQINQESAKELFEKSQTVNQLKKNLLAKEPNYHNLTRQELDEKMKTDPELVKARADLGTALLEFQRLYESISLDAQELERKESGALGKALITTSKVFGNLKSLKASVDFSFFRQLQSVLASGDWRSFGRGLSAGYKAWIESKTGVDTMLAEILTRPNALNGNYTKYKIDVGIKEEAFPESWLSEVIDKKAERFNLLRRSDSAFNVALQTARAEVFDTIYEKTNGDTQLLESMDIGGYIGTITGRGNVRYLVSKDEQQNRITNNLLFAPKWLASRLETIYDLRFALKGAKNVITGEKLSLVEKGRAKNAIFTTVLLAMFANLMKTILSYNNDDDDRGFFERVMDFSDPRSSDFGKIVVGTTRFDITTGTAGLITMLSRITTGSTISASGVKRKVGWGDIITNFLEGKASPGVRTAYDWLYSGFTESGKNLFGRPGPWKIEDKSPMGLFEHFGLQLGEAVLPISIQSIIETGVSGATGELQGTDLWASGVGVLADFIGISANTYDVSDSDKGKTAQALAVEKRVAWETNKQPISAKLRDDVVIFRGRSDSEIKEIREQFAKDLSVEETKLINSDKFKKADMATKDQLLRDMRNKLYAQYKKKYKPKK